MTGFSGFDDSVDVSFTDQDEFFFLVDDLGASGLLVVDGELHNLALLYLCHVLADRYYLALATGFTGKEAHFGDMQIPDHAEFFGKDSK
jgi:hypothetical protein